MSDNPFSLEELSELEAAEQAEMEKLALPFSYSVEVRPTVIPSKDVDIADFMWAVKITSKSVEADGHPEAASRMYVVGGEPDGPFRAIQRAIDRHAFGIELSA